MPQTITRPHRSFKSFNPEILAATDRLFLLKPWREENDDDAKLAVMQAWLDTACAIYQVNSVRAEWNFFGSHNGMYRMDYSGDAVLQFTNFSLMPLFRGFAEHKGGSAANNPFGWAASLFYTVRPKMFRKRVREGRINIDVRALYSTETLSRLNAANLDPAQDHILAELARIDAGQEEGYGFTAGLEPEDEADALAALSENSGSDSDPVMMTASSVEEPDEEVAAEIVEQANTDIEPANMNTRQLRRHCTNLGMSGTWDMSKDELLAALTEQNRETNA